MFDSVLISSIVSLTAVPYYFLILILLGIGKFFFDLSYRSFRLNNQLLKQDCVAVALVLSGYLLALSLSLISSLNNLSLVWQLNMLTLLLSGVLNILLLRLSLFIQDKLILFRFSLIDEFIQRRNSAVGLASAGLLLANGLVLMGVNAGSSSSLLSTLLDTLFYWGLAQILLILAMLFYQLLTPYDFHLLLSKEKNLAASAALFGFALANGLILRAALYGSSSFNLSELLTTLTIWIFGLLLMFLSRQIVDYVFLPGSAIRHEIVVDRNLGVGAILASFYIIAALIFSAVFQALTRTSL